MPSTPEASSRTMETASYREPAAACFFITTTSFHERLGQETWTHYASATGEVSAIIISSLDLAKEVLKTHDAVFANRPSVVAIAFVLWLFRYCLY
jgi:hypothetical protein